MNFKIPRLEPIITEEQDKMGFKNAAIRLAIMLDNTELPNCFGIYGVWGSGKTSLMKLTKAQFENNSYYNTKIATAWFNPWEYEYEQDTPIIYPLLFEIQKNLKNDRNLKILFKKSIKAFSSFGLGAGMTLSEIAIKSLSETDVSIKDLEENLNKADDFIYSKYEQWAENIKIFKDEYNDILQQALKTVKKEKLIIFIDDMDRCTQENAVKLLEVMKTYLSVENVLFVIGVDQRMLVTHINQKYQANYGKEYLNKIIPFSIQVHGTNPSKVIDIMLRNVDGLTFKDEIIAMIIRYLSEYCGSNVRLMFTVFTSFITVLSYINLGELQEKLQRPQLIANEDQTIIAILRWCLIRSFYPDIFDKYAWEQEYSTRISAQKLNTGDRALYEIQKGYYIQNGREHPLTPWMYEPFPRVLEDYIGSGLFKDIKI